MLKAKIFKSGNSQAIRIPKELRTNKKEYIIHQIGENILLIPSDDPWAALKASIGTIPDDFMNDREQPEWDEITEREDL